MAFAEFFNAPGCFFFFQNLLIGIPDIEQRDKIGKRITKRLLGLIRFLRFFSGSFTGILNTKGGGDDDHFLKTPLVPSLDKHSRQSRIDGHLCHEFAFFRQQKSAGLFGPAV